MAALALTASGVLAKPPGGRMPASLPAAAADAATNAQMEAARAAAAAKGALSRATNAIQASQATQRSAREAAQKMLKLFPSGIKAGIGQGGLDPIISPDTWIGGNDPLQWNDGDRTKVEIDQTQERAIFSWKTFNVSESTDLHFDQQGNRDWIALNRVLDPNLKPSRILGSVTADGTVLVINQNGIVFGAGSQVNVGSLMASTLDFGPPVVVSGGVLAPTSIAQRNQMFLQYGILGYADSGATNANVTFSRLTGSATPAGVEVEKGAEITTAGTDGLILLMGPKVVNAGHLSAPSGQVILAGADGVGLTRATGAADSADPSLRGLAATAYNLTNAANPGFYVWNKQDALIEAAQGNITLATLGKSVARFGFPATEGGAVINDGVLSATTSVSRNGSIYIAGGDVRLSSNSLISITPDTGGETVPQDPASLAQFKPSKIQIGNDGSRIEMQSGSLLYAPSANVTFGVQSGATDAIGGGSAIKVPTTIFIDDGAVIDVAGLTDVLVPISRNQVVIDPAKRNELRDSPLYRLGFLNGATIYLDARRSGVRDDGVAWIGSPLIDAKAYYELVGVSAPELMTKGGTVTLGASSYRTNDAGGLNSVSDAGSVIVKSGATIDISGGWVNYEPGMIRTTRLIDSRGHMVDIGDADPNGNYVAVAGGFTRSSARWGIVETWANPYIKSGRYYASGYSEGRDAGALTIKAASAAFEGTLDGHAYAGSQQIASGKAGSGKSAIFGDGRAVQGAASELPAGGLLFIQADGGGGNIVVTDNPSRLPSDFGYGESAVIGADGSYTAPVRNPAGVLPAARVGTIEVADEKIQEAGLSGLSLSTSGSITVEEGADLQLNPGGAFSALAGRSIRIDGSVTAAGGRIALETYAGAGSIFAPTAPQLGSYDIVVNGRLDVAGRWINDWNRSASESSAWLNGGSISMYAASRVLQLNGPNGTNGYGSVDYNGPLTGQTTTDISGSILINAGSKLNLASGGRVDTNGKLDLTAKGGNLSLISETSYFQVSTDPLYDGARLRVLNTQPDNTITKYIVNNPDKINARIAIDPNAIEAHGFGGGGTFTLTTPQFQLGSGTPTTGTALPMDFFSSAGFSTYNITSYKTDLSVSAFANGKGGYNALLATQTLAIGAGQTLSLSQSMLPSVLNAGQADALRSLASGGDVLSVVSPGVPADAWDAKGVNLNLGGLLELHVAQGGKIVGAAGSSITASKLYNEGTIRLPGGSIKQELILPAIYASGFDGLPNEGAVHSLSEIFSVGPDGMIDPNAPNAKGFRAPGGRVLTNQEVAGDAANHYQQFIYLLGILDRDEGIVLAPGSVTDLSGTVIANPRAMGANGKPISAGRVIAGGTIALPAAQKNVFAKLFKPQLNSVFYFGGNTSGWRVPQTIVAEPGSTMDLSGAAGSFDQLTQGPGGVRYVPTAVWSDAGRLLAGNGATLTGANIDAHGGAPAAAGGTLQILNPVLAQHDPATPAANVVSADMIASSGFDTLAAIGSVTSAGDVTLRLGRGFFLEGNVYGGVVRQDNSSSADPYVPVIKAGGVMEIDAPYIGINSAIDAITNPNIGVAGTGSAIFRADAIDISGAVIFDRSVANATLEAKGDIRLTGIEQWQNKFLAGFVPTTFGRNGALAANGNLSLIAGQVYPTTGSTFTISSTAANGTITFGRSGTGTPSTPYSAGGNLSVYAANVVQGGVVRVPFGTLTLGSNTSYSKANGGIPALFAPATQTVTLLDGSITGVSANGLVIPYGTTTDQKEWYFSPTGGSALSGPPTKVLSIGGADIAMNSGATVDITGGGDVYAYEFVPGTGGSRDVLDRMNVDPYSTNNGFQYPDARQVYAIVPGLSDAPVAAYDPIYSADYAELSSMTGVGKRVYLSGGDGLAAGWYTLLPAKYAMLPGGMRVVEQTGVSAAAGSSVKLADGTLLVSGRYGDALSGASESRVRQFSVQSQAVIRSYSNIVITSGSKIAKTLAASNGTILPRIGADAGQLILNPLASLQVNAVLASAAAEDGRGSQVDIGGRNLEIRSNFAGAPASGVIQVTADSLTKLNAGSLLIGGIRTDNADGTTSLLITGQTILVANDAEHPLSAPEVVLVVDDQIDNPAASSITLADGATIIASGTLTDQRSGNYVIDGRVTSTTDGSGNVRYKNPAVTAEGGLFRVANGPERLVTRLRDSLTPVVPPARLTIGNIMAKGSAIGIDTSSEVSVAGNAVLQAKTISLGAPKIAFTSAPATPGTVVLTPQLQALLSQSANLTLHAQTTIGFDDGAYQFGSIVFDAQGLLSRNGGSVAITGEQVRLSNSTGIAGVATGGTGSLDVTAKEIGFGSGAIATNAFGAGVHLTATQGVFSGGTDGVLDVGGADLTVTTPYIGDRSITGSASEAATDLTLRTAGALLVTNAGMPVFDAGKLTGIPGSALTLEGNGIVISGAHLRATAGVLDVKSSAGITLANAAKLETPGYEKTFGDRADPLVRSAAGGALTLAAQGAQGLNLGNATLSVGGGKGNGGKLSLSTPNGSVDLASAVLDGSGGAGSSGGTFSLDTRSAIDLVGLNTRVGTLGFTGGFEVRTHVGDITLDAGQMLRSGSVKLTADGGFVTIGGAIDTSGINGGNIALYGTSGVTLQSTARLDAHADGYAADDTRRARAGDVTLGTDYIAGTTAIDGNGVVSGTSGTVKVMSGAVIDVAARRPGDRLVRLLRNGNVFYQYVQGDEGGSVNFRAPVYRDGAGNQTVNVTVASAASIVGARSVGVEGFRRWDLAAVAGSGLYTGVTRDPVTGTITLDVRTGLDKANADGSLSVVAGDNFLGDKAAGTVVDFVQSFDISAMYGNLGGLASQANFHARPGVDLAATGDIVLASNWNLGAGTVDLPAAVAAGYMTLDPRLQVAGDPTSGYVVKAGFEDEVFANHTRMTYRTGGSVSGEAPVVALRAGGNLRLKGSLTDGFFMFRDQTDATYLNKVGNYFDYTLNMNGGFNVGSGNTELTKWSAWDGAANPAVYLGLSVGSQGAAYLQSPAIITAPYTAVGNSPAALGTFVADSFGNVNGGGDPVGSAVVFPLLPNGAAAASSSYLLVAGAANLAGGSARNVSADPTRVDAGTSASLSVEGSSMYRSPSGTRPRGAVVAGLAVDASAAFSLTAAPSGNNGLGLADWANSLRNFSGASNDAVALLYLGSSSANDPNRATIMALFGEFAADGMVQNGGDAATGWRFSPGADATNTQYIAMSVGNFKRFVMEKLVPAQALLEAGLKTKVANPTIPNATVTAGTGTRVVPRIRTGTGSITMLASGDVDLRGAPEPVYVNATTGAIGHVPTIIDDKDQQLGGAAVYTVGRIVDLSVKTVTDPISGVSMTINPATYLPTTPSVFGTASLPTGGTRGAILADPLLLEGGGDLTIAAGRDVLGRRGGTSVDEPWRIGSIGNTTISRINPYLFNEGLGALGGGNITVDAGRDVSDLTMISDASLATASVTGDRQPTRALLTFGGGNIAVRAARDIIAGRFDIASGAARLSAGRDIADGAPIVTGTQRQSYFLPGDTIGQSRVVQTTRTNQLRIRIADATVDLSAGGGITLQGVAALGVVPKTTLDSTRTEISNRYGFYSAHSGINLLANGSVVVTNDGATQFLTGATSFDLLTQAQPGAGGATVAVYPASVRATSMAGDVKLIAGGSNVAKSILMVPSSSGQLQLLAARDIAPTNIAMLDSDPGQLPGLFSTFVDANTSLLGGVRWDFPAVSPSTSDYLLGVQHNKSPTHKDDDEPVYVYAGNDIGTADRGLTLSVPKQARIGAGRDIVNMVFFGQNIDKDDITRIVAGRDITATTRLVQPLAESAELNFHFPPTWDTPRPSLQGNTIILGGPGELFVEAGRDLGPFLNSAVVREVKPVDDIGSGYPSTSQTYAGGILTVGNLRNPYLPAESADINVSFGVGKGADYAAVREAYVKPGSAANALGGYDAKLLAWMRRNAHEALIAAYGTDDVSAADAYALFVALPELRQRDFLINEVYFNELRETANPNGPSYLKYSRGYTAVNTLFPASLGYTQNSLEGGASDTARVLTGDLDLRLAAIETMYGGNISILGPGGRVLAGSTVATAQQAARRTYEGGRLFAGGQYLVPFPSVIHSIPSGYEGVLTLRGGDIKTFTDGDFLLNQSRLFTQRGGNILMWSSNGDLNAGQGPKTSANFPPIVTHIDQNATVTVDALGGVTGAGIAALKSAPDDPDADVYLIAPRGTVDAGDAGVRVSGNLSVAAFRVANADNFKVSGVSIGVPAFAAPDSGSLTSASNTAAAVSDQLGPDKNGANAQPSVIIVEILGFGGGDGEDDGGQRKKKEEHGSLDVYDPGSAVHMLGNGQLTEHQKQKLTEEERARLNAL